MNTLPRTAEEMQDREREILAELLDLERQCATADRWEYRKLSDQMLALEEECLLWSSMRKRLERQEPSAVPSVEYAAGYAAVAHR